MATLFATALTAIKGMTLAEGLIIGGQAVAGAGAIAQGRAQNSIANFQAKQLEAQGKAEQAAATLEAENQGKQKRLVMSRARAVSAASGGGPDLKLLGDIEEEGTYRTLSALWTGEEAAKGRTAQAGVARFEGQQYKRAGLFKASSTILSGGSSLMEKYG